MIDKIKELKINSKNKKHATKYLPKMYKSTNKKITQFLNLNNLNKNSHI